jgi:hypothetical protein
LVDVAFFEPFIFLRTFHELTHVILMPEAEGLRTWSSHGSDGQRPSALVLGPLPLNFRTSDLRRQGNVWPLLLNKIPCSSNSDLFLNLKWLSPLLEDFHKSSETFLLPAF